MAPTTINELDEFVNWENGTTGADGGISSSSCHDGNHGILHPQPLTAHVTKSVLGPETASDSALQAPALNSDPNLDLALEDVSGDDFSFWALEHFSSHNSSFGNIDALNSADKVPMTTPNAEPSAPTAMECWETPSAPCGHCKLGGYQCKRIQEGKYKGYCTSCVALRCECSFGFLVNETASSPSGRGATFPANPWPTIGDHPNPITNPELERDLAHMKSTSTPDLSTLEKPRKNSSSGLIINSQVQQDPQPESKKGARFSKGVLKILKNWLATHSRHPYPSDEEKESLVRQTGLSKLQITNYFANARRRGKIQAPRSTSPHVRSALSGSTSAISPSPIDIPRRRGTPSLEAMNPLQRWVESPPDHEPATVADIARAVATDTSTISSGLSSPYGFALTDDGSGKSLYNWSSASSLGTSHSSNNSFASAYSHGSRGSLGSVGSFNRGRRRRRRRNAPRQSEGARALNPPLKTYQCTFCTLTFKTKHDWQRHEKSLHLSLERWVCAPDGARTLNPNTNQISCVFCGQPSPDDAHIDAHNHCACQERSLDERTFYRKDHLRQHLKLVHNVKFLPSTMESWKVATPEIRSRCGFCGIVMDTWTFRVDHLAEHFKGGLSMADWKGDWGFDAPVLQMVENSIPPFLIHNERNSPLPYTPGMSSPESPRNAYDLLKLELANFVPAFSAENGRDPSDMEMKHEACRIIYAAEVLSHAGISSVPSWLRDLVMSSPEIAKAARLEKVRGPEENVMPKLKINGKDNIFDDCDLEKELNAFVKEKSNLGLTAMDSELQEEACRIIGRQEEISSRPADFIANWLLRLIYSSSNWLAPFRQRAALPRSEDVVDVSLRSKDPSTIDSTIYNYSRLETELAEYVAQERAKGIEPTDVDLQRQGRIIIYEFDDAWNQTAADNEQWLAGFRQRHVAKPVTIPSSFSGMTLDSEIPSLQSTPDLGLNTSSSSDLVAATASTQIDLSPHNHSSPSSGTMFLNDANCYRRLARELGRWVKSVMSPNNPNCHIPSDEEMQHQARWILYDDGDPWNQTAADNAEWLRRFKRDVGLISDHGPGLPETDGWALSGGGSGFAPPYVAPGASLAPFQNEGMVPVCLRAGTKSFDTHGTTANKFIETLHTRFPPLPKVFCPRELESGLLDFARHQYMPSGRLPSDDDLRAQARLILGTDSTPADDAVLLEGFKAMALSQLEAEKAHGNLTSHSPMALSGRGDVLMNDAFDTTGFTSPNSNLQSPGLGFDSHISPQSMYSTHGSQNIGNTSPHEHSPHCIAEADKITVNMTESELDELLKDMNFEMDAHAADLAASAGLGLDHEFSTF